jgi:hypothetical protein
MREADQFYRGRYCTHKLEVEMTGADQLYRGWHGTHKLEVGMVLTSWR